MRTICEIKAHPRRDPEEMRRRLGISRRQFYKDRETLAQLGFSFHYSRKRRGFVLDKELTFSLAGMSLADLFTLILAVRELAQHSDFALAMGALAGLRNMVAQLPEEIRPLFSDALDQVVVGDGFGCRPEVLDALLPAVVERRRVVLVLSQGRGEERLPVDPKRLLLRRGALFLEAGGLGDGDAGLAALSRVRKVIPTPFFSPPDRKPAGSQGG
jgi:predicted DNA-binding transcriptional regulator YafY